MQVKDPGNIGTAEELASAMGVPLDTVESKMGSKEIVPINPKWKAAMESWGLQKRKRYAELVYELGEDEAFHIVEFHKGEIQESEDTNAGR